MNFRSNDPKNWQINWSEESNLVVQEGKSVWDVIDEIKFGYLHTLLPDNGIALEVGCGSARLLYMLTQEGWQTVGIDFVPSALEIAKKRFLSTPLKPYFIYGDAYQLPFEDESFDLVTSTGLLEHFEDPKPIVIEMLRVLRPGGVFYSDIVPHKFSLLRALDNIRLRSRGQFAREIIYEHPLNKRQIQTMFAEIEVLQHLSIFPAGIFLPRKLFSKQFPFLYQLEYGISKRLGLILKPLDGSWIADLLGVYYFVSGVKI